MASAQQLCGVYVAFGVALNMQEPLYDADTSVNANVTNRYYWEYGELLQLIAVIYQALMIRVLIRILRLAIHIIPSSCIVMLYPLRDF